MKTLNIYNEKDLSSMTLVEITEYNNIIASAAGLKTTKRFASKPKAISKTLQNCAAYLEVEKAEIRNQRGIEKRQKAEANKSTSAKAKKVKAKLAAKAKPVKKADNTLLCVGDKVAKKGTAMGFVQNAVTNGHNTVEKATNYFIARFVQPRGEAKIDRGFARGHVVGAIRLGYLAVKK